MDFAKILFDFIRDKYHLDGDSDFSRSGDSGNYTSIVWSESLDIKPGECIAVFRFFASGMERSATLKFKLFPDLLTMYIITYPTGRPESSEIGNRVSLSDPECFTVIDDFIKQWWRIEEEVLSD